MTVQGAFVVSLVGVVFLALYLIPSLVTAIRHHHNELAIFILNFLLGWTGLGWVVALVWACTTPAPHATDLDIDR
jgi:hypothetical protein